MSYGEGTKEAQMSGFYHTNFRFRSGRFGNPER